MELEEMFKQVLANQLAEVEARKAAAIEAEAQKASAEAAAKTETFVTKADVTALFAELSKGLVEEVSKAFPIREAGAGRLGVIADKNEVGAQSAEGDFEAFIQKAIANPDRSKLTADEREALWKLSYSVLTKGLSY